MIYHENIIITEWQQPVSSRYNCLPGCVTPAHYHQTIQYNSVIQQNWRDYKSIIPIKTEDVEFEYKKICQNILFQVCGNDWVEMFGEEAAAVSRGRNLSEY